MGTHDPAADAVLPKPEEKKQYVRAMFDGVASKYDFLNHLLSLGIDIYWRRRALKL
ncbi:MAG TPA: class I SAM-dependent methyltransferase, partial [bacterium]|nr:class I SAM-dependent methyltransferase [bacterium]